MTQPTTSSTGMEGSWEDHKAGELIRRIRDSADELQRDRTARGDLKILSRTLRELRYAFKVFSPYRDRYKVTIFGSARTLDHEPAYQQAVELGRQMAAHDWLVVTGAASGIMEAGHVGAGRDNSMGLNIMLPFEQAANDVIRGDTKLVNMKYFFTRKLMFVKECDAVVCLPGGFGTLDEALEVLTLLQTGKRELVPVVFLDAPGGTFWNDWNQFVIEHLAKREMICDDDFALYKITDDVTAAKDNILDFYRVYHSMRYVGEQLVLRCHTPVGEDVLATLNAEFDDIVDTGDIHISGALPDEAGEPELASLSRLVFRFDRKSHGRLRMLIDRLNHLAAEPRRSLSS